MPSIGEFLVFNTKNISENSGALLDCARTFLYMQNVKFSKVYKVLFKMTHHLLFTAGAL